MKHFLAILSILGILAAPVAEATVVVPIGQIVTNSVAIASSGTTSAAISTNGLSLVGLLFPTITSTAVTFTVSSTVGGTYVPLYNASGAVSYTIASGRWVSINPADFAGVQFFKIVMGTSEGSARTIIASLKGI